MTMLRRSTDCCCRWGLLLPGGVSRTAAVGAHAVGRHRLHRLIARETVASWKALQDLRIPRACSSSDSRWTELFDYRIRSEAAPRGNPFNARAQSFNRGRCERCRNCLSLGPGWRQRRDGATAAVTFPCLVTHERSSGQRSLGSVAVRGNQCLRRSVDSHIRL